MIENANLIIFLFLVIIIARSSVLLKKIGQPALLGELLYGILIAVLGFYNINYFKTMQASATLAFLSELGAIFLLFEIGLESDMSLLKKNGLYAIIIAVCGAILPFLSGYIFASYLPNTTKNFCLFFAATLSATSTGIAVRVFKEYKLTDNPACQIVLAASVIDDIVSLLALTCITAIATTGNLSMNSLILILIKIILFFAILYLILKILLPRYFDASKNDYSLNLAVIVASCMFASWLAHLAGLSSIIGAFIAGLFISRDYFQSKTSLVYPFVWLLTPIFFIYSGMQIDINSLLDLSTIKIAFLLSIIAVITKVIPPLIIPNKIGFLNKLAIGFGMVPRGEIGLIIGLIGKSIGILNTYYFNVITLMVIFTSFISPILLNIIIKKIRITQS